MTSRRETEANARSALIAALQANLADAIDLYNAARQAHWNVKGPHFAALHALFKTFYETLAGDIDELAERIVQLGGTALGTTQSVAETTRAAAYPTGLVAGMDHVRELLDRYAGLARHVRAGIAAAEEAGDAATADLLTGLARNLDKAAWMLEAHLQAGR